MVAIKDYDHMTILDKNVNWMKLTHLLSKNSLYLRPPFYTSTFPSKYKKAFLDVHNNTSPLCIICMPMPRIIPFYLHRKRLLYRCMKRKLIHRGLWGFYYKYVPYRLRAKSFNLDFVRLIWKFRCHFWSQIIQN